MSSFTSTLCDGCCDSSLSPSLGKEYKQEGEPEMRVLAFILRHLKCQEDCCTLT